MTTHNIQETTILENIGRYLPRICVALDNIQAKHQYHMIEAKDMFNKQPINILIDLVASHSYINPNNVEMFHLE